MTNYNHYVLVFYDESKIKISEQLAEKIKKDFHDGIKKTFEIKKSVYRFSDLRKIVFVKVNRPTIIPEEELTPEQQKNRLELIRKQKIEFASKFK